MTPGVDHTDSLLSPVHFTSGPGDQHSPEEEALARKIEKVKKDYIHALEDDKQFKVLKHLKRTLNKLYEKLASIKPSST